MVMIEEVEEARLDLAGVETGPMKLMTVKSMALQCGPLVEMTRMNFGDRHG